MDLNLEFPDELRPEPAVGNALDEALKAAARPGSPWTRQDAEITQANAAARERRDQGEIPRSLPMKTSS